MCLNASFDLTLAALRIFSSLSEVLHFVPLSDLVAKRTIILINISLDDPILLGVFTLLFPLHLSEKQFVYNLLVETSAALCVVFVPQVYFVDLLVAAQTCDTWLDCFEDRTVGSRALLNDLIVKPNVLKVIILVVKLYSTLFICNLGSLRKRVP
jgi:hypothetical protein